MGRDRGTLCLFMALTLLVQGKTSAQEAGTAVTPVDAEATPAQQLAETVSRAIVSLDATGTRSSEAIADSAVTLVLGDLQQTADLALICQSSGERLRDFVQSVAQLRVPGTVSKPTCSGTGTAADPFKLAFQLHQEGGQDGLFRETPLLLNFASLVVAFQPDSGDSRPIDLGVPHAEISHSAMALPKSWSPEQLPQAIHADSSFASFDRSVTFEDGKLIGDQKLVIKVEKVEGVDRTSFVKWLEPVYEQLGQSTQVKLGSTLYYPWSAFTGTTEQARKAADLMGEASTAIENKNFAEAEAELHEAESLDPGHELLHRYKGDLEGARGHYPLALAEYQEELKAFPGPKLIMESIAFVQSRMGRNEDAILTLQQWMNAEPDDIFPPLHLMNLYHELKRDDLAVATGDRAMLGFSEDSRNSCRFLLAYGHEQMLTSQVEAAQSTLNKLLDRSTDIDVVNDATYFLSEHALSLDRAEQALRLSLQQFEPENEDRTEHLFNLSGKDRTGLLFASWDTLGWILFKQGRAEEAESYIRAAWRNHPDPAIGRHVGELLLAADKSQEALDAFHLALATIARDSQEKASTDPDVVAIHQAIVRLEKQGLVSSIKDPVAALARLRVLDAGPAGKRRGEEEYELALTAHEIEVLLDHPPKLEGAIETVQAIKPPADLFPTGSRATIMKTARLVCNSACTLIFLP